MYTVLLSCASRCQVDTASDRRFKFDILGQRSSRAGARLRHRLRQTNIDHRAILEEAHRCNKPPALSMCPLWSYKQIQICDTGSTKERVNKTHCDECFDCPSIKCFKGVLLLLHFQVLSNCLLRKPYFHWTSHTSEIPVC